MSICDLIILGQHHLPEVAYLKDILLEIKEKDKEHNAKFEFITEFETQFNEVLSSLVKDNKDFIEFISVIPLIYSRDKKIIIGGFDSFLKYLTVNFSYTKEFDKEKYSAIAYSNYKSFLNSTYKYVYFTLNISDKPIVLQLFNDVCPKTTLNFIEICKGVHRNNRGELLSYKDCEVFRVVKGSFIQTGDLKNFTGNRCYLGSEFEDENFIVKHDKPGIIGMVKNKGRPHSNQSQFYLTLNPLKSFDGKFVAFGRVVSGYDVLLLVNEVNSYLQRPVKRVEIVKCGEFNP